MKKLKCSYFHGLLGLLHDDLVSFFAFFTTILIEIAYIWTFEVDNALTFTILLLACIVNVIAAAAWKGKVYGSFEKEQNQSQAYVLVLFVLFLFGCLVNFFNTLLLMGIPFAVAFIWINLRIFQNTIPLGFSEDSLTMKISRLSRNKFVYALSCAVVLILPIVLFAISLAQTDLPTPLKFMIPIVYALLSPFIAYMEDSLAAYNIFELASVQTWHGNHKHRNDEHKYDEWDEDDCDSYACDCDDCDCNNCDYDCDCDDCDCNNCDYDCDCDDCDDYACDCDDCDCIYCDCDDCDFNCLNCDCDD